MTVLINFGTGETHITCNACGVPVLGLIRCSCTFGEVREWCEDHACTCGDGVDPTEPPPRQPWH
jgi:hypothetical protein